MGPLKTAGRSNELFKNDLILAKCVKKKMHLAKIKSFLNGSLDRPAVLSGPMAFHPIYSHKYFHIFIYFIHQVIADFSKHAAQAIATLVGEHVSAVRWVHTAQRPRHCGREGRLQARTEERGSQAWAGRRVG